MNQEKYTIPIIIIDFYVFLIEECFFFTRNMLNQKIDA